MKLDFEGDGLLALMPLQNAFILKYMWDMATTKWTPMRSRDLWEAYNRHYTPSLSRAAIINALKGMVYSDDNPYGVLETVETSGKGGVFPLYYPRYAPIMFETKVKEWTAAKLKQVFSGPWWKK